MKTPNALFAAAALLGALSACAELPSNTTTLATGGGQLASAVARSVEQGGKFISLVGPKRQHAEPFLGVPGTNFFALRSMIDTRNGETVHQLFVEDSYFGAERKWEAARDPQGRPLRFTAISKDEITCENGCSYAEEFGAAVPEAMLRASPQGFAVTFAAHSGATKTVTVPGDLVANQLTAVADARAALPTASSAPPPRAGAPRPAR